MCEANRQGVVLCARAVWLQFALSVSEVRAQLMDLKAASYLRQYDMLVVG